MGRKSSQLSKEGKQANGKIPQQITAELGCVYSLDKGCGSFAVPQIVWVLGGGRSGVVLRVPFGEVYCYLKHLWEGVTSLPSKPWKPLLDPKRKVTPCYRTCEAAEKGPPKPALGSDVRRIWSWILPAPVAAHAVKGKLASIYPSAFLSLKCSNQQFLFSKFVPKADWGCT